MRFPTPHTVIFIVILLAAAASWLLPAGQFDSLSYDSGNNTFILTSNGAAQSLTATQATLDSLGMPTQLEQFTSGSLIRPVKVPGTYQKTDSKKQGLLAILFAPVRGSYEAIDIILLVMMLGGFIRIYTYSGVLQAGISDLSIRFRGRERWLIIIITFLMAAGGSTFGLGEETIAFYPILVPIFLAAGYDRIVPLAVIFAGSQVGIMGSTINPFSVIIASYAAGVSWDSGLTARLLMLIGGSVITVGYILRYAEKVRKDPSKSMLSEFERTDELPYSTDIPDEANLSVRQKAMLALFGLTFVAMIAGITFFDWWMLEMTALFLASGVVSGLLLGLPERKLVHEFLAGAGEMVGVSLVIGMARGVTVILNDGNVTDTVLYYSSILVADVPVNLFLTTLIVVFFGLTFVISSTSGLALISMPIMGGLAISLGIPGEAIVSAFVFGSGLMLLIAPTSMILPSLAMVNVKFDTWLKFILPLMGILFVFSVILMVALG